MKGAPKIFSGPPGDGPEIETTRCLFHKDLASIFCFSFREIVLFSSYLEGFPSWVKSAILSHQF